MHQNHLLIGREDKTERLLDISKPRFLLIDDGPIAAAFLEQFPKTKLFDPFEHSFNPLQGMDYLRACDFVSVMQERFAAGSDTLTKEGAWDVMLAALLERPRSLAHMLTDDSKDSGYISAQRMIRRLLMSPVLRRVFCERPHFKFGEASVVARLDRSRLGDFDAFIIALLLIGQHKGQVIVPDGGFYLRPLHVSLIRQDRLTVGLRYLAELPLPMQHAVLAIEDKHLMRLLPDDAETLIGFTDHPSGNPKNLM